MKTEQVMVVCIAAFFGLLAALIAYSITSEEYEHHFSEKKQVARVAIEMAAVAFLVFLALGVVLAVLLPRLLRRG